MNRSHSAEVEAPDFDTKNFDIGNLQDEIRVDALCERFLRLFHRHLIEGKGFAVGEAGSLTRGADYFLRDFIIPDRRENIFALHPKRVRQFAGNWYIVKNLEPNMAELVQILAGVQAFYGFCREIGKVPPARAEEVEKECAAHAYYRERIDRFWEIEDNAYMSWEQECSLKD